MPRLIRSTVVVLFLAAVSLAGPARGANEGQDDLDRAMDAKLTAKTAEELGEVIRLADSALQKGLDEGNTQFAEMLLASTLTQRGAMRAADFFAAGAKDAELRQAALADLDRAVQVEADQPEALFHIARLHLLPGGDRARAVKALDRAIDLLDRDPLMKAKALLLRSGTTGDLDEKLADLDEAIRLSPGEAAAYRIRALLHVARGKLEEALGDLDKAVELSPKTLGSYELKAAVLLKMEKPDEALATFEKAKEANPDSVEPLVQKAKIHVTQGQFAEALAELDRAFALDAEDLQVLLGRAVVHQALGDKEKALADVDRALELRPKLPPVLRLRAMVLADAQRLDEAIAQMEELQELVPGDMSVQLQLGLLLNGGKKHLEAVECFSAVLLRQPDNWAALRGRGDARLSLGQHKEAISDFEEARKLQPKDPGILNNLAWVLATSPTDELRDGARAVELATGACEVTEYGQAHILSTLAAAYAETGDFESAVKWSQKAVEAGSEDQREHLEKELESFRAKKPWRENLAEEP
ncbi:MAG TPA: tetratricopeptide repeat protein [Thermoguttaceae bacterium]|nr:tetratricopeptide repeat protein [Thermoguttaceae bacterium]